VSRPMRGQVFRGQRQGQREDARGSGDETRWRRSRRRRRWRDVWDVKGVTSHSSVVGVNIVQYALLVAWGGVGSIDTCGKGPESPIQSLRFGDRCRMCKRGKNGSKLWPIKHQCSCCVDSDDCTRNCSSTAAQDLKNLVTYNNHGSFLVPSSTSSSTRASIWTTALSNSPTPSSTSSTLEFRAFSS
jgi:hypothetical protein